MLSAFYTFSGGGNFGLPTSLTNGGDRGTRGTGVQGYKGYRDTRSTRGTRVQVYRGTGVQGVQGYKGYRGIGKMSDADINADLYRQRTVL